MPPRGTLCGRSSLPSVGVQVVDEGTETSVHEWTLGRGRMSNQVAKGLSQPQLSRLSGVPQPMISKLENGEQESITFVQLEVLADALGVNAAVLVVHEPKGKRG